MHSTLFFWWGANETVVFSTSNRATLSQCAQLTYVGCYGNMQSRMKLLPSGIALVQSTSQSHHTPICFIGQAHTSSAIAAFSSGVTSSNPIQASHLPHTHVHSMHTCPCTHSTQCTACTAQQAAIMLPIRQPAQTEKCQQMQCPWWTCVCVCAVAVARPKWVMSIAHIHTCNKARGAPGCVPMSPINPQHTTLKC